MAHVSSVNARFQQPLQRIVPPLHLSSARGEGVNNARFDMCSMKIMLVRACQEEQLLQLGREFTPLASLAKVSTPLASLQVQPLAMSVNHLINPDSMGRL